MADPGFDWAHWTDWRWTSRPITTYGGLHGSMLLVGPFGFLASLAAGKTVMGVVAICLYGGFLWWCAKHKRTPYQQLQALHTIYVHRGQWRARV